MIEGRVTGDREAIIPLKIIGPNGAQLSADFVLDTGFTDFITLSPDEVSSLDLLPGSPQEFYFANGESGTFTTYYANVMWDGAPLRAIVLPLPGVHLLGMRLLSGSTITVEAGPNGLVTIEADTVEGFKG